MGQNYTKYDIKLVSLTIWKYTFLYLPTIKVFFYQVKMLLFYNLQTSNLTFVGKNWDV